MLRNHVAARQVHDLERQAAPRFGHDVVQDADGQHDEALALHGAVGANGAVLGSAERSPGRVGDELAAFPGVEAQGRAGVERVFAGPGREVARRVLGEVAEGIHAYGIASHRHAPEIEQGLSKAAGRPILVNFTPHLMPMNRGILETIYVRFSNGAKAGDLRETLAKRYADEPFVHVVPDGVMPATRHVRGSNAVLIGVFADRVPGRAILIGVEDNLVKGASGQGVQVMNVDDDERVVAVEAVGERATDEAGVDGADGEEGGPLSALPPSLQPEPIVDGDSESPDSSDDENS